MKKRILISLLSMTLLTAGLLVGCSDDDYVPTGLSGSIKLYSSIADGEFAKYEQEIAKEYMKINKDVSIDIVAVSEAEMESKILADMVTNSLPDAFYTDQNFAANFEYKGMAVDNALYLSKNNTATFIDGVIDAISTNENMIMVPMMADPVVLIYRSDWLSEKGNMKTIDTYAEFKRAANLMTSDGKYGVGLMGKNDPQGYSVFMTYLKMFDIDEAYRAGHGNWDSDFYGDDFIIALQEYYDLAVTKGYSPARLNQTGYAETLFDFSNETTGMVFVKYSDIYKILEVNPELEGKIGVTTIPKCETEATIANVEGYVVSETSKSKSLVNDYLTFMASHENMKVITNNKLPVDVSLLTDDVYRDSYTNTAISSIVMAADAPVFPKTVDLYAVAMETFSAMVDFNLAASDIVPRAIGDVKTVIAKNT